MECSGKPCPRWAVYRELRRGMAGMAVLVPVSYGKVTLVAVTLAVVWQEWQRSVRSVAVSRILDSRGLAG